ncbi:MAG: hypothetical protein DHS20C13_17910 [Thermodesulfobacteriota bacterium]|nr:MAG: hypothetical protein DHS20C13_17910 [Thermodesulfobacteriota bacterium]
MTTGNKTLQNNNLFTTIHGILLEVEALGILIIGKSGIGKSDTALELITRGSKLITDDVVEITVGKSGELIGSGPDRTKYLMEIRGVGIINVMDLYGDKYILKNRDIDMVIELTRWDSNIEYDRLGVEENYYNIMGVELPYLLVSIRPGTNTATIIELAVRNQILKSNNKRTNQEQLKNAG